MRLMNWKRCERYRKRLILRYYPGIYLQRQRKTTKINRIRDLPGPRFQSMAFWILRKFSPLQSEFRWEQRDEYRWSVRKCSRDWGKKDWIKTEMKLKWEMESEKVTATRRETNDILADHQRHSKKKRVNSSAQTNMKAFVSASLIRP